VDKVVNVIRARQLLARAYQALGDEEEATVMMTQGDELYKQSSPRYQIMHQIEYEYYRIRCQLLHQKLQAALQWVGDYEQRRQTINSPWVLLCEFVYAHVLLVDGRPDQALEILKTCEDTARSSGTDGWVIQSVLLQSLCYSDTNDMEKALETLSCALGMAEPEGYIRSFVDHGLPMQQLLQLARARGIAPEYVANLLAAFPEEIGERSSSTEKLSHPQRLVEQLTDQELSILRLMSAGLSHREIADEMYLSVNTIKWHTTHIYSKLGVHRRAHAVVRAKELGIL
jgi:LuxR family maltose regulon positive regulatory protein